MALIQSENHAANKEKTARGYQNDTQYNEIGLNGKKLEWDKLWVGQPQSGINIKWDKHWVRQTLIGKNKKCVKHWLGQKSSGRNTEFEAAVFDGLTFQKIVYMFLPIASTEKCLLQKLFSFVLWFFLLFLFMVKKSTGTSEITSKVGANYHLC